MLLEMAIFLQSAQQKAQQTLHATPSVVRKEIECAFRAHNRNRPAKRRLHSK